MDHEKSCADLKEMLSSFCPAGVKSDLSFECTKQDSSEPCDVPLKEATPSQLRNKDAYFRRVKSFSYMRWFAKPTWLSPLNCARYGWENVDIDILQCISCKAFLSGKLPSSFDPHVWSECMKRLQESVWASHRPFCAWASNPCPEQFMRLPLTTRYVAVEDFKQRVRRLLRLGDRLPQLKQTSLDSMDVSDGQLEKLHALTSCEDEEDLEEESTQTAACVLALTGWTSWGEDKLNCVGCRYCNREAGLWNFKSKHNETDEPESPYSDIAEQPTSESCNLPTSPTPNKANTEQNDSTNHIPSDPHLNDASVNHDLQNGSLNSPATNSQEAIQEPHDSPDQSTIKNDFLDIIDADNIQTNPSLSLEPAERDEIEVISSAAEEFNRENANPSGSSESSESSPSPVEVAVQDICDVSDQSSSCRCSDVMAEENIHCEPEHEELTGSECVTEELKHREGSQSGSSQSSKRSGSPVEQLTEDTRQSSGIMETEESVQSKSESHLGTKMAESSRIDVHQEACLSGSSQEQDTDAGVLKDMFHTTPESPEQSSRSSEPDHQLTESVESVPKELVPEDESRWSESCGSSSPLEKLIQKTCETSDQDNLQSKDSDHAQTTINACAESEEHGEMGSAVHTDSRSISPMDVDCSSDVVAENVTVTETCDQDSNQQQHTETESRQERSIFSASFDDSYQGSGGKQSFFSEGMVFGSFRELANKQRALDKTAAENSIESLPNPAAKEQFTEVRSPAVQSDGESSKDSSDTAQEEGAECLDPRPNVLEEEIQTQSRDTVTGGSLASPKSQSENAKVDEPYEEMEHTKQTDEEVMNQSENKDTLDGVDRKGIHSDKIENETVKSDDCVESKSSENIAVDSPSLDRTSSRIDTVVIESVSVNQSQEGPQKPSSKRQLPDEGDCPEVVIEPTPKRRRLVKPTRVDFDPVGEHRLWCPWVIQDQPTLDRDLASHDATGSGNQSDNSVDKEPGWKQFLLMLVSETSGDVSFSTGPKDVTTSPIQSLISARKLLKDAKSPRSRLSF